VSKNPNLELLTHAARILKPMLEELVFVGGCTTALLITDEAASAVRPTKEPRIERILTEFSTEDLLCAEPNIPLYTTFDRLTYPSYILMTAIFVLTIPGYFLWYSDKYPAFRGCRECK
jgi:hypothetical protein